MIGKPRSRDMDGPDMDSAAVERAVVLNFEVPPLGRWVFLFRIEIPNAPPFQAPISSQRRSQCIGYQDLQHQTSNWSHRELNSDFRVSLPSLDHTPYTYLGRMGTVGTA